MNRAVAESELVASRYGRNPWRVAEHMGVPVFWQSLPSPFEELYFSVEDGATGIILTRKLQEPRASELLAHAIGHHRLHCGNRLARSGSPLWSGRHEREANDFAAALLLSPNDIRPYRDALDPVSVDTAARELGVSLPLLERRLRLIEFAPAAPV